MWDVDTLKCLSTLTGHSGAVRALAASSKRVFSGSDDTTIKVTAPGTLFLISGNPETIIEPHVVCLELLLEIHCVLGDGAVSML